MEQHKLSLGNITDLLIVMKARNQTGCVKSNSSLCTFDHTIKWVFCDVEDTEPIVPLVCLYIRRTEHDQSVPNPQGTIVT